MWQWTKWATWLYFPDDGRVCMRHLHWQTWREAEKEVEKIAAWRWEQEQEQEDEVTGVE